ncbi:hypothetical protein MJH12_08910, partial [bacterium]|nr:hypothetical protein [bacterium]
NVKATVFSYDATNKTTSDVTGFAAFDTATYSGKFVDFSFSSTSLTTGSTFYAVVLEVTGANIGNTSSLVMPFRVRPDVLSSALLPKAIAIIDTIETQSLGTVEIATDTFSGKFSDDFVFVTVDGLQSTNPAGGDLEFSWAHSWVGSTRDTEGAPKIRFLGLNREKLVFGMPIGQKARTLQLTLTVKDIDTGLKNKGTAVLLTLASQVGAPPVADAGGDEFLQMGSEDSNVEFSLNGFGSFSPVGHVVTYKWTHSGAGQSVFAGQNFSTDVAPVVTLTEGAHYFKLEVSDSEDTQVEKGFDLVIIEVEQDHVVDASVLWDVEGRADAFPRDAFVNQTVDIKSFFDFFPSEENTNPTPTDKFKHTVTISSLNEDGSVNAEISANTYTTRSSVEKPQFATPGEYLVEVVAWVDLSDNGSFDQAEDFSYAAQEHFVIVVEEKLFPIHANILTGGSAKFLADASTGTSITMTFEAKNPNSGNWEYDYRFSLFNVENFDETIVQSATVSDGLTVVSVDGQLVVTATQDAITVTFQNVKPGEYEVSLEVEAFNDNDAQFHDFKGFYFRVVSDKVKMLANVIDPDDKLDWSTVSVDFYPVTSQSLDKKSELASKFSTSVPIEIDPETQDRLFGYELPADINGHKIVGILVEVVDTDAVNADNAVKIAQFFPEVPREGEFEVDLVNRSGSIDIEGTYLKPGDYFSFNLDEVATSAEDDNGNDRTDLDLVIGETTQLVVDSTSTTNATTLERAVTFAVVGTRRVVPVQPFSDEVGTEVSGGEFFQRALSNGGNVR